MESQQETGISKLPCRNQGDLDFCYCNNCSEEMWDYFEPIYREIEMEYRDE
tara:strand:- start:127 stop:279 length:153 start_codon:yes stop_codon:yes gene_type:complete